ncbi:MAG: RNA polymerase sigma factor SigI [Bacillota bacterium]
MDDLVVRDELLSRARDGDRGAREKLVELHRHFILSAARACCKQRINWSDDAASVALIAFDEAVDAYKDNRGVPFPAFARLVIRSRIADFFRKEGRKAAESLEELAASGGLAVAEVAYDRFSEEEMVRERREEIKRYGELLQGFGLNFRQLADASPKHRDARAGFLRVARVLAQNEVLFKQLMQTKRLPLKELAVATGVPRKTLERGRRYIVAVSLIFAYPEEFTYMYSYLKYC